VLRQFSEWRKTSLTWLYHFSNKEEMMFFLVLLVLVLFGGALVVLVIENLPVFVTAAPLSFFVWQTPPLPMGSWLLISCVFGAVVLYVVSVKTAVQERRELRRLRQHVAELERVRVQVRGPSGPLQAFPPAGLRPGVSSVPLPPFPKHETA
jgi:uncharacterized integral membrane protein